MSLADACVILRAAAACPVRLTLLRQRHEPQSDASTAVDLDQAATSSGGLERVGPGSSSASAGLEPSDELTAGRTPPMTDDEAFDAQRQRRRESQSSDDVSRDLPLVPGPVGVHSTYIDLSTVVPPADNSQPSDEWNSDSPPSAFFKTQSSPTLDKTAAVGRPAGTSSSVEELHTHVRRAERLGNEDLAGRSAVTPSSSSSAVEMNFDGRQLDADIADSSHHHHHDDDDFQNHRHVYCNVPDHSGRRLTDGKTERVLPTALFAGRNNGLPPNAEEPTYVNHSNVYLQRQQQGAAGAPGLHGSQPLPAAVKDADVRGLERALRAPERCAAGGLAYYINLEDHHFTGFPGHRAEARYHSADDLRTS